MGVHLVFYFMILLPWLIPAATSLEAGDSGCQETCGTVAIPFPFGIETGCYFNSWFKATCNETTNGPKPFISRINLELLGSNFWAASFSESVIVNNPVAYQNCGNKGNNGTISPASINLKGSPFFFSSTYNLFGSVGCGNMATVFRDIETDPIAGCLQQRCGNLTSKLGGCLSKIPEGKLTSYTAIMTEVINPGSKRCTSTFLFDLSQLKLSSYSDLEFPRDISIDKTHVPATLEWNPVECDLEAALCPEVKQAENPLEPSQLPSLPFLYEYGCIERCGNVDIPSPFGIKLGCYTNNRFKVTCNDTADGPKPFISSINMQILNVSFLEGTVVVKNPITYLNCLSKDRENNGVSVNLTDSFFFFSNFNKFMSVGCGSLATILRSPIDDYPVGGCQQPYCGNIVTPNLSCSTNVPLGLSSFVVNMTEIYPSNSSNRSCGSTFIVDERFLNSTETINSDRNDTSNWTHVPTTLQWGTPKGGLCELREGSKTFCSSDAQYCWTSLNHMHLCVCTLEYGYVYSADVCKEVGKCVDSNYRYCFMLCFNAPGNNCSSSCPDGYEYSSIEDICKPINLTSPPEFRREKFKISQNLPIIVACSTSIVPILVLLGTWKMYKVLKTRKDIKLKQKYFKRNGGLLLQQQLSSNEGNVEKIKFFASKELEKATDYYNKNRILGQGGQGTVYKGMLIDGSIVAIKKSKMVEEKKLDETKLEQFINEVIILSQINHRNVVKLLGCCLEIEVPLLVYEFIPNGTLYQLIHEPSEEFPFTWEMRLRIAIETANALFYLHSAASVPIYHRDIKSSNILVDDKYRAKVSDFGTSRSVALEQTHVTTRVQGTFGYLDPEYFRSNQFTEKSDVYSFGVVLVELLTGQKPISSRQSEEIVRSLVTFFLLSMKENSLFDILDEMVLNNGPEKEIAAVAKLAKRCLNLNGKKRPTMKQVALELEWIRSSEDANAIQQSADEDSDIDDMIEPSTSASCSMSTSIVNDSVTLPVDA